MVELILGDCLTVLPTLDEPVDAIIADLPYGTTACKWDTVIPFEPLWTQYKRLIKPKGAIVLFGSQPFTSALVMSNPEWFKHEWIWEKDGASNFAAAKHVPLKYHENVLVFAKNAPTYNPQKWDAGRIMNKPGKNGRMSAKPGDVYGRKTPLAATWPQTTERYPSTVIRYPRPKHNGHEMGVHPTQKPVALLEYLIRTYTNAGETVLDNTMGSGTTGVACVQTGRKFIGIEIDEGYFEIACRRIREAQAQPKLVEG